MHYPANSVEEYIAMLPEERTSPIKKMISIFEENLPDGFEKGLSYKMIGFYVPHTLYPAGYHCNPKDPLPFINIASQKNFIALYHMGIYANSALYDWFVTAYPKHCATKLDMGKSCVRFKKMEDIPYELLKQLATKVAPQEWIECYEKQVKKKP